MTINYEIEQSYFCEQSNWNEALSLLSATNPFRCFDLNFPLEDIDIIQSLEITERSNQYDNYGNLEALEAELEVFFNTLSIKNVEIAAKASQIINDLVKKVLLSTSNNDAHFRIQTQLKDYIISDYVSYSEGWHIDGEPFSSNNPIYKFVYSPKGNSTRFHPMDEKVFETKNVYKFPLSSDLKVINLNKEFSCDNNQMAVMLPGYCPHRSPTIISEDRIFISIESGSKEEIKYLIENN